MKAVTDLSVIPGDGNQPQKSISEVIKSLAPDDIVQLLRTVYLTELYRPGQTSTRHLMEFCNKNFSGDYEKMSSHYENMAAGSDIRMKSEAETISKRLRAMGAWDTKLKELQLTIGGQSIDLGFLVNKFDQEASTLERKSVTEKLPYFVRLYRPATSG